MDEDEIEGLTTELRTLLDENGFGWMRQQGEAALDPSWHPRWLALALLDAAENVTVDLANAELAIMDAFGTDEIRFEPGEAEDFDSEITGMGERSATTEQALEQLHGPQRRGTLEELADTREAFQRLRELISDFN